MISEILVSGIQVGFITTGTCDTGSGVIRHHDYRYRPKELQHANMGADPVRQLLGAGNLGIGITAGSQGGLKGSTSWLSPAWDTRSQASCLPRQQQGKQRQTVQVKMALGESCEALHDSPVAILLYTSG